MARTAALPHMSTTNTELPHAGSASDVKGTPKLHVHLKGQRIGGSTTAHDRRISTAATILARKHRRDSSGSGVLSSTEPLSGFIVSAIVAGFLLHLSLTRVALSLLTCESIQDESFLVGDYSVDCNDPANLAWMYGVGVTSLLVYGVGIPMCGFLVLWVHRTKLHLTRIQETYGFLYASYSESHWYWEVVVQSRKVLLAVISVFLQPEGAGLQVTCAVALLSVFALAQERSKPFRFELLNALESGSIMLASITLAGGAALMDTQVPQGSKEAVTIALVLLNACFVAVLVGFLVHGVAADADNKQLLKQVSHKFKRISSMRGLRV
jgi:hypothetical protein